MAPKSGGKFHFLVVIFLVIVAIHLLVLSCIVPKGGDTPDATVTPEPAEERSFWQSVKDWFSSSDDKKTPGTPAEQPVVKKPEQPETKQAIHYWKKSTNPNFGKAFNFSKALRDNSISKVVPGVEECASGIVVDMDSRKVLWEKKSNKQVSIASMTKMMTLLLVFEELERNPELSLDKEITITKTAMNVPRTGVLWLSPGEKFKFSEIIRGAAIKSANDAAEMCAEITAGSVSEFINRMNKRSRELGLSASFTSTHGLPDKSGKAPSASAKDMVILGERLLEYPDLMSYFSIQQDSIREGEKKTIFVNTNRLINPHYPGVDGMKTGYTKAAGFCLTFSAVRDGRRIMGCVTGFKSAKDRDRFCRKLIDWAYTQK